MRSVRPEGTSDKSWLFCSLFFVFGGEVPVNTYIIPRDLEFFGPFIFFSFLSFFFHWLKRIFFFFRKKKGKTFLPTNVRNHRIFWKIPSQADHNTHPLICSLCINNSICSYDTSHRILYSIVSHLGFCRLLSEFEFLIPTETSLFFLCFF